MNPKVGRYGCESMKTYENTFFQIRLSFPDTWDLTSWRHTRIARLWQSAYQAKDDDLPGKGNETSKFLFTAALHPPESNAVVDADIELSVFLLSPGENMRTSLVENVERERQHNESSGIARTLIKEGVWTIGGMDFSCVDQESKTRNSHARFRFIFRPQRETFWLYGKIAGHKIQAYFDALEIVEGLRSTAESNSQS